MENEEMGKWGNEKKVLAQQTADVLLLQSSNVKRKSMFIASLAWPDPSRSKSQVKRGRRKGRRVW